MLEVHPKRLALEQQGQMRQSSPCFEESFVDIAPWKGLDTFLVLNVNNWAGSDYFMNILVRAMIKSNVLIIPVVQLLKHDLSKDNNQCPQARIVEN